MNNVLCQRTVLLVLIGLFVAIIYNANLEYYEDVLSATDELSQDKQESGTQALKRRSTEVKGGFSSAAQGD